MNIGAMVQEIQNAKKQELPKQDFTRYDKKSSFKRDVKSTIYYYQNGDDSHIYRSFPEDIYVPIENYSDALIRKLDLYLNRIDRSLNVDTVDVLEVFYIPMTRDFSFYIPLILLPSGKWFNDIQDVLCRLLEVLQNVFLSTTVRIIQK